MEDGIGGYFELELLKYGKIYHPKAIAFNSARNCFEYILRLRQYKKIYIPYYTCEVILEPLKKCSVDYEFYHINENLDPLDEIRLEEREAFLYTNYYGLKQNTVEKLVSLYGNRLIIDNAQAFFAKRFEGIDTFYSARKFFGVPDGAYLYTDKIFTIQIEQDYSYSRMEHLLKRADVNSQFGLEDFRSNEELLVNQNIRKMSMITKKILSSVDYEYVKNKRRANYSMLDTFLRCNNGLCLELDETAVPMVYPYLTSDVGLRSKLLNNKVFIATYWPNVFSWSKKSSLEYKLSSFLLPLPIDQRYGKAEMNIIIELINNNG